MEITPEEYVEAAKVSMHRLAKLCDYQERHIENLERQLSEAQSQLASLQEETE